MQDRPVVRVNDLGLLGSPKRGAAFEGPNNLGTAMSLRIDDSPLTTVFGLGGRREGRMEDVSQV